jgi:hypothetical protein
VFSDDLEEEGACGGVVFSIGGFFVPDEEVAGGKFKSEEAEPIEGVSEISMIGGRVGRGEAGMVGEEEASSLRPLEGRRRGAPACGYI